MRSSAKASPKDPRRSSSVASFVVLSRTFLIVSHFLTIAWKSDLFLITDCIDVRLGRVSSTFVRVRPTHLGKSQDVCNCSKDAFCKIDGDKVFGSVDGSYSDAQQLAHVVIL